ncbi:YdcF family protein [Salinarimonas rosea]|uniref:YdcF family protein n=1 Tax=Salinarimonas rosea TaxID=552063 RepID=UPI0006944C4A|nr:YdcF family protein [Salinarimonas rosea]
MRPPRRRSFARRMAGTLFGAALLMAVATALGFFVFVATLERHMDDPGRADAIVALTGGSQRVGDALDLLARGKGDRLLISGVHETTTLEEIARLNPGRERLLACCVDLDHRARNTIGNAIETRRWAAERDVGSLIVVTSNYHMPRTLLELENASPDLEVIPYAVAPANLDTAAWWYEPNAARLLAVEYLKFLAVWLRTAVEGDPERSPAANMMSGFQRPIAPALAAAI